MWISVGAAFLSSHSSSPGEHFREITNEIEIHFHLARIDVFPVLTQRRWTERRKIVTERGKESSEWPGCPSSKSVPALILNNCPSD
jgi:hypothetical protein